MPDDAKDTKKAQRERREQRRKIERSASFRHLREQLMKESNRLLDSTKEMDIDVEMRGIIAKRVHDKLDDLEKRYGIEQNDLVVLRQLALLNRFYPSAFLEKCDLIDQCFQAGITPFELIDLGELHMEFAMSFLYEIRAMRKGFYLARKRKAESQKSKDDRRFAKVYCQYIEKKDTLENLLKKEFPERILSKKGNESYNSLKSAYYRAVKRIGINQELSLEDFLHFFWDKTALLHRYDINGNLLTRTWRFSFKSSTTRSKLGIVRDYFWGINSKKYNGLFEVKARTPYYEMLYGLSPKTDSKM